MAGSACPLHRIDPEALDAPTAKTGPRNPGHRMLDPRRLILGPSLSFIPPAPPDSETEVLFPWPAPALCAGRLARRRRVWPAGDALAAAHAGLRAHRPRFAPVRRFRARGRRQGAEPTPPRCPWPQSA